ncbi:hypothetical protein DFS33DRAFT_1377806 [Desarmillaria ectypa]|nr:hypothetical protein DFS33DRAFT_1377806 [Desarmillaria ectypa]
MFQSRNIHLGPMETCPNFSKAKREKLFRQLRLVHSLRCIYAEFKWKDQYGDIVRVRAALGEDRLLVSDPKALQHIYQTSGYRFIKPPGRKEIGRMITGSGILSVQGDNHKRHRKVLLPGFSAFEVKFYVPAFFTHAGKVHSNLPTVEISAGLFPSSSMFLRGRRLQHWMPLRDNLHDVHACFSPSKRLIFLTQQLLCDFAS